MTECQYRTIQSLQPKAFPFDRQWLYMKGNDSRPHGHVSSRLLLSLPATLMPPPPYTNIRHSMRNINVVSTTLCRKYHS